MKKVAEIFYIYAVILKYTITIYNIIIILNI